LNQARRKAEKLDSLVAMNRRGNKADGLTLDGISKVYFNASGHMYCTMLRVINPHIHRMHHKTLVSNSAGASIKLVQPYPATQLMRICT
jgi:hypothetical protein